MDTYSKAGLMACAFATLLPFTAFAGGKKATPTIALSANAEQQSLSWAINKDWQSANLRISSPNIDAFSIDFDLSQPISFSILDIDGNKLPDGLYTWELKVNTEALQTRQETAPDAGGSTNEQGLSASGVVSIVNGSFVIPKSTGVDSDKISTTKDIVHLDDVIINQSLAVGQDAVNGEDFGFDTIRLKENNLRIKFQDTSNSASFPSNDWQITINDSSNGGANKFSIDDIDAARTPFTIEAGAPSHSLYVDDGGRIGLGTSTPVVELHSVSGDTPTLRLEQDGSSGFTAQSWDLGSNETNFFIRDATNGSRLPFKIRPSAPNNSFFIDSDGDIGLGTTAPAAGLHILATDNTASMLIQDSSSGDLTMLELRNNGAPRLQFTNTDEGENWRLEGTDGEIFSFYASSAEEVVATLSSDGDMSLNGDLVANGMRYTSDFNAKEKVIAIDTHKILEKVVSMPISEWSYISDKNQSRHIGPMAQDFKASFGLGSSDTSISVSDTGGVALAAIQGLNQLVQEKDAEISELKEKSERMEQQLELLMKEVQSMKAKN